MLQNILRGVWPGYPGPHHPGGHRGAGPVHPVRHGRRVVDGGSLGRGSPQGSPQEGGGHLQDPQSRVGGGGERWLAPPHGSLAPTAALDRRRSAAAGRAHAGAGVRLPPGLSLRRAHGGDGPGSRGLPLRVRRLPEPDPEVRGHAPRVRRLRELYPAGQRRILPAGGGELVRVHLLVGGRQAGPRHGDGAGPDVADPLPELLHGHAPHPVGGAHRRLRPELPLDLRRQPRAS